MLGLIVAALRARRATALVMLVLAAVTMGAAVAAGAATGRTERAATTARIDGASPAQRTLTVRGTVALGARPEDTLSRFRSLITGVATERTATGARYSGVLRAGDLRLPVELRAVDGFCAEATVLQGRCATADGEIVLRPDVARQLGLAVGDPLRQDGDSGTTEVPLTLVGLYAPADPLGWFWSSLDGTAAYTTLGTVAKPGGSAVATYDALLPTSAFDDPARLDRTIVRLRAGSLDVYSGAPGLAATVAADRHGIRRGLLLVQLQILLCGGLAVAVAAGYAAHERRADAARMAIRGLPRWRVLTATAGQSLLPLLAGAAWAVAVQPALWPALAVAVVVVLAADWPATRASVPALLRVVQPRRPLAAATLEVCVLALGAAAVFQLVAEPAADVRRDTGLGLSQAAPLLIALAAGVLATRALLAAAGLAGRTALAAGRVGGALAGLTLGRRRTAYRIVPVLAAAVCVLAVAAQDWTGATGARGQRAAVEVGADRVLRVAPVDRERLLTAVRAADPGGRDAMAVAVGGGTGPAVIAVDSARLRAVTGTDLPSLRGTAPPPLTFTGATLALRSASAGSTVTLQLTAHGTGERLTAVFRPAATVPPPAAGASPPAGVAPPGSGASPPAGGASPSGSGASPAPPAGAASPSAGGALPAPAGSASQAAAGPLPAPSGGASSPAAGGSPSAGASPPSGGGSPGDGSPGAALVESTVEVAVPQCGNGCRLVSVEIDRGPVELTELRSGAQVVVDGRTFADPARWRTTLGAAVSTVQAGQRDGRLRLLDVDPPSNRPRDNRLYVVDTPVPLPALVAGELPPSGDNDLPRVRVFGTDLPVTPHPVASIPRGGAAGVLVDLEDATRLAVPAGGTAERLEVWLGRSAPADLPDRLRAAGLTIAGSDTVAAATARADHLAPAVTLRAGLAGGAVALLLAAVTAAVVAAVDRRQRTAELAALRRQGLPAATARTVGRWTAAAPVLVAVPVGLAAAVLLRLLARPPVRPFADRWPFPVLPVQWLAIAATAAAVLLLLLPPALWTRSGPASRSRP